MLFPGGDLALDSDQSYRLRLLEGRADIDRRARGRDDRAVQALAGAERHAGEIGEAGRGVEIDGLDARLPHQGLQLGDAGLKLFDGDWSNCGSDIVEFGKRLFEGFVNGGTHGLVPESDWISHILTRRRRGGWRRSRH
ncbi:hypothetical protein D3C80_1629700 [compost metagenome]